MNSIEFGCKMGNSTGLKDPRAQSRFKSWGSKSGKARIEGEARERAGEGSGGGGSVSPSPENFWNFGLQIVQSGV